MLVTKARNYYYEFKNHQLDSLPQPSKSFGMRKCSLTLRTDNRRGRESIKSQQ
ncbi:hypothetical protein B6N60_03481 [Richelia sinica FACHB-800]|uniref:Uncharacterized protein n=1 Tax=Richelia sinica FACHB-800 TaxID=1357546 RepID=A0A975TB45_9NOST|nr:hypothetical protein B6N60_03481 [Richelia sinica FACHB-800]